MKRRGTSSVERTNHVRDVTAGDTRVRSPPLTAYATARPVAKEADRSNFARKGEARSRLWPKGGPILPERQATSRPRIAARPWLHSRWGKPIGLASAFRPSAD